MEHWIEEEWQGRGGRRPPRRRALVGVAIAVVAGTALGICAPVSPMVFWGAGAAGLLPLFLWVRRPAASWPLAGVALCLVAAHAGLETRTRPATSLPAQLARPMEYVQFVAVALEDAAPRGNDAVFRARVEGLNRDGNWVRVADRIRVVLRSAGSARAPRYGERWRLRGIVRVAVPRRSGLFTLPENQAVVDPDRAVFLDAGRGNPLKAWCMGRRRACRAILSRGLEDFPEERGLLQALLLGYREDLPKALRQDFAATGTVHIFAISGAHVGMVTLMIAGLLRALAVPLTRWFLFLTPLLALYTLTTGAATSAVRACVMAALMLAAPFLRRRPDAVSTLAAAAAGILLAAPAQLGDLGFLLSFTAVAGLLAIQPLLDAGAVRIFRRDDWQLPAEERPRGRWAREGGLRAARFGLVTVSAWIGTMPLTAYFFNLFSPVALGMNLLVIPAAFVILLAGVMSLLCAPFGSFCPEVFNHAARAVASFLTACIEWAAAVPGGHWFVRTPPAGGVVAWYVVLAAATVMARRVRGALAAGFLLLAALALGWGAREARRCRVTVLDVGEGAAALVQARTARVLVDTGPAFHAEETLRQLRGEGVNRLEALVLTHADARHIGAAAWLMGQMPVRELWIPAIWWPSPVMREILREADAAGLPIRRLHAGVAGQWPGGVAWDVAWPPETLDPACADDAALAMRVARYGAAVLLAGDLGGRQEEALAERGGSAAAAVLVVGRHGAADATSAAWLDAVRPKDAVISAGPHSEGRHPDDATLARLAARGIRVWRTDRLGPIAVDFGERPARWPEDGYRIHGVR